MCIGESEVPYSSSGTLKKNALMRMDDQPAMLRCADDPYTWLARQILVLVNLRSLLRSSRMETAGWSINDHRLKLK